MTPRWENAASVIDWLFSPIDLIPEWVVYGAVGGIAVVCAAFIALFVIVSAAIVYADVLGLPTAP